MSGSRLEGAGRAMANAARSVLQALRGLAAGLWAHAGPRLAALAAWAAPRGRALLQGATRLLTNLLRGLAARGRAAAPLARASLGVLAVSALLAGGLLATGGGLFVRIPADAIAVRQVQWGGAGIEARDQRPGLQRRLPGRELWHELRAGTHLIVFAAPESGGTHDRLEIATVEGETCLVSAVVPYRILAGSAHRLVMEGMRTDYPVRAVAICRRVLLEELATLTAEQFADPGTRAAVEANALGRLRTELAVAHLEPLEVRIGEFFFDGTYEKKMLEQQLSSQDQLTQATLLERHQQERLNAEERGRQDDAEAALRKQFALREEALKDAHSLRLIELQRSAESARAEQLAEAEVRVLELNGEGELALAAAEDLRRSLFDEALQSPGGRLHVARQAAENLRFGSVTLDTRDPRVPNLLDLDQLVQLLVGSGSVPSGDER